MKKRALKHEAIIGSIEGAKAKVQQRLLYIMLLANRMDLKPVGLIQLTVS